jgi:hypothetical protein
VTLNYLNNEVMTNNCVSKTEGKGKGHPITGHEGPTGGVEV